MLLLASAVEAKMMDSRPRSKSVARARPVTPCVAESWDAGDWDVGDSAATEAGAVSPPASLPLTLVGDSAGASLIVPIDFGPAMAPLPAGLVAAKPRNASLPSAAFTKLSSKGFAVRNGCRCECSTYDKNSTVTDRVACSGAKVGCAL